MKAGLVTPYIFFCVFGVIGIIFADGWVRELALLAGSMSFGFLVFGFVLEPKYLTQEGLDRASGKKPHVHPTTDI